MNTIEIDEKWMSNYIKDFTVIKTMNNSGRK